MYKSNAILGVMVSTIFVVSGVLLFGKPSVTQQKVSSCPSSVVESFGLSFNELRSKCFETRSDVAEKLSCNQLRTLATNRDESVWPEGMIAHRAAQEFCDFDIPEYPADSTVFNEGLTGDLSVELVFDEARDRCQPRTLTFDIGRNTSSIGLMSNGWIAKSDAAGLTMLGPIERAIVFSRECGLGHLELVKMESDAR